MIEKTRIHRAMLRLDRLGGFCAQDVQRETAANAATVRKVFERDRAALLLEDVPGARPGRERPVRLTVLGRARLTEEAAAFRAVLGGVAPAEPEPPAAELALEVTLATIGGLTPPLDMAAARAGVLLAAAELGEAVSAGLPRAVAIANSLRQAGDALAALDEDGDPGPVCERLQQQVAAWREAAAPDRLDGVVALLPGWRAAAAAGAATPAQAARLLEQAIAKVLGSPAEADTDLDEAVRAALDRRAQEGNVANNLPALLHPDTMAEMKQIIKSEVGELGAQMDAEHALLFKMLCDTRVMRTR